MDIYNALKDDITYLIDSRDWTTYECNEKCFTIDINRVSSGIWDIKINFFRSYLKKWNDQFYKLNDGYTINNHTKALNTIKYLDKSLFDRFEEYFTSNTKLKIDKHKLYSHINFKLILMVNENNDLGRELNGEYEFSITK